MDLIKKLQNKPIETRIRILWTTVAVVAVVLVVIFVFSVKTTLKGVDSKNLVNLKTNTQTTPNSQVTFASVERIEQSDKALKIYFNFNNPSNDILTISKLQDISLTATDQTFQPQSITDRQGQPFVQKILSHTQNFGILIFNPVATNNVTLTFNQMYLEKTPDQLFQQKLDLNLNELSKPSNLRN